MKRLRISAGILVFLVLSLTGYIRETYLINISGRESVIQSRTGEDRYYLPRSLDDVEASIANNPKWVSSLIYSLIYSGLSAICVWLIFRRPSFVIITLAVHLFIILFAGLLILAGLIFNSFNDAYSAAEYFKNLVQSSLLTLILITGFLLTKRK